MRCSPKMLQEFLTSNRAELVARCKAKAAKRFAGSLAPISRDYGVPLILEQITKALSLQGSDSDEVYEPAATPTLSELGLAAAAHGTEMMQRGYRIDQVVHEYGDVCQSVTELAEELKFRIETPEFRTLNRCLDSAIADAVTSYESATTTAVKEQSDALQARIEAFSQEQSRLVEIALSAFAAIRSGNVGASGATGKLLSHTLAELLRHGNRTLTATALPGQHPLRQSSASSESVLAAYIPRQVNGENAT